MLSNMKKMKSLHYLMILCSSLPCGISFIPRANILSHQQNPFSKALSLPITQNFLSSSSNSNNDDDEENRESINPIDLETPEERRRRMENVRKIQKSFYGQQNDASSSSEDNTVERTTTTRMSHACNTILENVPLWRVQWTELPGFQNLLNCHVAHYTHMFHGILAGPKPHYFGHVFLEDGSENLNNPEYRLLKKEPSDNQAATTKATYTGVLMKVADSKQLEDGRLALVVQALERFQILEATQHEPYAIATVQLLPDAELALDHFQEAQSMAQELSDDFLNDQDAWGAACAAALETAEQIRGFEYRPVTVESSSMGAISPLVFYDVDIDTETVFPSDKQKANAQKEKVKNAMEQHLFSASPMVPPDHVEGLDLEKVLQLEHAVWLSVDTLVKLLNLLNPNPSTASVTPVPTQMLGLLPRGDNDSNQNSNKGYIPWPEDFDLERYVNRLEEYAAAVPIGTYSRSPFVRYDYADSAFKRYPALRRAQRLSFVVWILMENIGLLGDTSRPLSRQEILEMPSITARLQAAKDRLDAINSVLQKIADEN